MSINSVLKSLSITCVLVFAVNVVAQNSLKYTYDALGRLTFVEDAVNGNRDYDYDAAGNRTEVSVGNATEDAPKPGVNNSLSPPSGLNFYRPSPMSPVLLVSWEPEANAEFYNLYLVGGSKVVVAKSISTLRYTSYFEPKSAESCNSDGCSNKAYF